jgi:phage replication-related protein YjqB (UPF0714/DUF867 family)
MSNDLYCNFNELENNEQRGKDYRIYISDVGSAITIIAPHGGRIEPGTSDIARKIAAKRYNCYCFEGVKKENNGSLHITSHRFDEPMAAKMASASRVVVSVHACTGNEKYVYLGGLDRVLKGMISHELKSRRIIVPQKHGGFQGLNPNNICNRGVNGKGVQLEITRGLRDELKSRREIAEAVRTALTKYRK